MLFFCIYFLIIFVEINGEMKDKTIVVCGSTQGIGWSTAQLLAQEGANLILVARNESKLKACVEELKKTSNGKHDYCVADFSNWEGFTKAINQKFENTNVYGLVNNTGGPAAGPVFSAKVSEFTAAFQQHLLCNHYLVQKLVPQMKNGGSGRIVNVISTSVKQPLPNLGVSNTIRGAVANWSKTLANELGAFNITVNNVLPGATNTVRLKSIVENKANGSDQTFEEVMKEMGKASPMLRVAEPEEVASAIVFLLSEKASYINGINVPVDGGRTKSL